MSTICKICLCANELQVVSTIKGHLRDKGRGFRKISSEWPEATDAPRFIIGGEFPSILSVKQVTADVAEIHFNSFSKVYDLVAELSHILVTGVVVNQFQSVATASYWSYHLNGELLREIEAGDGEVISQSGLPLDFESVEPGQNIAAADEYPLISFGYEDMDFYNVHVGIPAEVYQDFDSNWHNFILEVPETKSLGVNRPWWKLW